MNKKKKIAVFGVKGFPAFGGAARANENIVNHLGSKYDYTIYAIDTHTNKNGKYNGYYQKVFKGYNGKRFNTLIYYVKSVCHALFWGKYDIVQINHTSSGFIAPLLRIRYKVVGTARGIIPEDDNKWNGFDKYLFDVSAYLFFRFSNRAISVSKPHIDAFKKYTNKEVFYIPNGIDVDPKAQTSNASRGDYILFAAGRVISLKGAHILLQALNNIKYLGETIIIGDLNHTPAYKTHLINLSENLNIEYTGLIKEKELLFSKIRMAKLFVFPSFNEGMSNMLLEVGSLKTPLICSDIPENRAVFDDSEVLFFKTGDSIDLAEKIDWANSNYSEMQIKAERAYDKLKSDYSWNDIAKKYSEIYESLTQ